ncbi:SRPBCC family protein [Rathayibacter soli]|uniref:SRPBCC family protein n=1 Tax=Rathayibacter soli TaxID=3144168 RepID=UPI0027E4E5DF|nr:SRPBCC family protein [Glaciibacter superstes]
MSHAEYRVTVPFSPTEVFAFLADGMNEQRWRNAVRSVSLASGPAGDVGAVYAQRLTGPGGREIAGDYRITEATPPTTLAFDVIAGPARPTGRFTLAPAGDGTSVLFVLDVQPQGLMRLMGRMIQKTMDSEVRQLDNLARAMAPAE